MYQAILGVSGTAIAPCARADRDLTCTHVSVRAELTQNVWFSVIFGTTPFLSYKLCHSKASFSSLSSFFPSSNNSKVVCITFLFSVWFK